MTDALTAVNAYRNQLKMLTDSPASTADGDQASSSSGSSFANMVQTALKGAADQEYGAEALQMQSMTGKVELTDLVTAVTSAELTMNTVLAVRDKVITAYQQIMQMPV